MKLEGAPTQTDSLKEKSPERLQAQVEIFADKGAEDFSTDQRALLKYSAELSKITDLDNLPSDLPEELVLLIQKNKDAYIDFLRKQKKQETSFIENNIKIYREKFQSIISELKTKIASGDFKALPEYLGSGSNGSAFRINVEGKGYAAKFSRSVTQENFEIKPLLRAEGVPHTAQLVSYSFEDGVVVMELLPGANVSSFTQEDAPEYSDADIIGLIETVRELDTRGVVIDAKPSNFMYDEGNGFSILDYHLKSSVSQRYALPQEIMSLKNALTTRKFEPLDYNAPDYEEKSEAQAVERYKIFLPMMVRFLGIVKEKYPDILTDWQQQHDEDKKDSNMRVGEIIDRENIPKRIDFEPYLKKLEELGF